MTRKDLDNSIYTLIHAIWGSKRSKGYHWIAGHFDYPYKLSCLELAQVIECLHAKKDQASCPIHQRVHYGMRERML